MAHNQDRLQNSDSSVVYGHGHIIYSHTVKPMLWSSLDCCCCCSLTWATHHYDKPSNSQLWVWMALLKNTSQSISPSPLALRERNVHFCIDFSSNKPNIHQFVSEHWIWCFSLCIWPRKRPFRKSFLSPQMTNDFVFQNSNFRLDFCGKIFLLIFKLHFDECRVKIFWKVWLMMQQIWN